MSRMDCTLLSPVSGQISRDNWKGIHGIFYGVLKFLYVCACHDFLRNSFDVLQNAGWETPQ